MLEDVKIEGVPAFTSVRISISAEKAARTASIECVIVGDGVPVMPGDEAAISASGDPILTGYVRDVRTGYDTSSRTLSVTLCSRTVDACECSIDHPTGEVREKDLIAIAKELDRHGIGIVSDGTKFPTEETHKVIQGETLFQSIERRARKRGALIYDTPEGKLKIASKPEGMHKGRLLKGVNILVGASASFTEAGRYSKTRVHGQTTRGTEKQHLRAGAVILDDGVKRERISILAHEGLADQSTLKRRAAWQAKRAAGNSVTAEIPVAGWRDAGGRIWSPNWLVEISDPFLGLDGIMIIKSVSLSQDEGGTRATLSLADPRALGGENPRSRHSSGYEAPGAEDGEYQDE